MATHAIVLSIGDELVLGQTVDTNSAHLSARLARRGIGTLYHQTVADDHETIVDAIRGACAKARVVFISGGLGPTADDMTRFALAEVMGTELERHEPSVEHIHGFFDRRGKQMPERNVVQAMIPVGAEAMTNHWGTAPGIHASVTVENNPTEVFCMPGVPREMFAMFEHHVEPVLDQIAPTRDVILTTKVNTFGMGESDGAERLGELMDRHRNPKVGTTVANGILSIRVRSESTDEAQAEQAMEETVGEVTRRLGPCVFGRDETTLQESVVGVLRHEGHTLATAESCTGGLIGEMITQVSGSSAVYAGGWVVYSNELKHTQLGVPLDMLEQQGAVSEPVARALAVGALARSGASLSLAVTGIAGPIGGTEEKPVGTIWLGLGFKDERGVVQTEAVLLNLGQDRPTNRDRSAKCALQLARLHAMGQPLDELTWGTRAGVVPAPV